MPVFQSIARKLGALILAAAAATPTAAEPSFVPVFRDNFPDPLIVEHQGEFIAYATNAGHQPADADVARPRHLDPGDAIRTTRASGSTGCRCWRPG